MKAIKKLSSVIMCLAMLFAIATVNASAYTVTVDTNENCSIKIMDAQTSNSTVGGKKLQLFKIFDAETDGANIIYKWIDDGSGNKLFEDFFCTAERAGVDATIEEVVDYINNNYEDHSSELSKLTADLHGYIHPDGSDVLNIKPVATANVPTGETSVIFDGLSLGYYMVYDATTIEAENPAVRATAVLTTPNTTKEIILKADRPTIDKKVNNADAGAEDWQLGTVSSIGDKETFKITTSIPDHTRYSTYVFNIEDKLPEGMVLYKDGAADEYITISATKNDVALTLTKGVHYSVTTTTAQNGTDINGFKVEFLDVKNNWAIDTEIVLTYQAELKEAVAVAKDTSADKTTNGLVYPNTATLTYTNDSHDYTTGHSDATATVYTLQTLLTKNAETATGGADQKRLAGAEFEIYRLDENGDPVGSALTFVEAEATCPNGHTYTKYVYSPLGTVTTIKTTDTCTGDDPSKSVGTSYGGHIGEMKIIGLGVGSYGIKETKAPTGYRKAEKMFTLSVASSINPDGLVSELKMTYDSTAQPSGGRLYNVTSTHGALKFAGHISNRPGTALPETGGIGTTVFTVFGVILMAGAIAFFTSRKRSSMA